MSFAPLPPPPSEAVQQVTMNPTYQQATSAGYTLPHVLTTEGTTLPSAPSHAPSTGYIDVPYSLSFNSTTAPYAMPQPINTFPSLDNTCNTSSNGESAVISAYPPPLQEQSADFSNPTQQIPYGGGPGNLSGAQVPVAASVTSQQVHQHEETDPQRPFHADAWSTLPTRELAWHDSTQTASTRHSIGEYEQREDELDEENKNKRDGDVLRDAAAEEDEWQQCPQQSSRHDDVDPQRRYHDGSSWEDADGSLEMSAAAQRLHLHPLLRTHASAFPSSPSSALATDPITAALARQQQQLYRGEPRSPLSPRTLQALCTASAAGRHHSFMAQLTPEEVLAPPPLALTWYPSVPPNVTQHADRKRRADGTPLQVREQHELERLAEDEEAQSPQWRTNALEGGGEMRAMVRRDDELNRGSHVGTQGREEEEAFAAPPLRRSRTDTNVSSSLLSSLPLPLTKKSACSSAVFSASPAEGVARDASGLDTVPPTLPSVSPDTTAGADDSQTHAPALMNSNGIGNANSNISNSNNSVVGGGASDEGDAACGRAGHAEAHRKRERGERVYEYLTHGRRLN